MDYDVVKSSVQNAYKYYGQNDNKFNNAMGDFYNEGKKNPAVAKIILQEQVEQSRRTAKKYMNEMVALNLTDSLGLVYPELINANHRPYGVSIDSSIKKISAKDLYKNTQVLKNEDLKENSYAQKRIAFDNKWQELYPKTGDLRNRIINSNRIAMDRVSLKADWAEKLYYAKTMAEYRKDYPKTFNARYFLLSSGQIADGEVTPSIKNWFRRLFYKSLVKGKYCFKK